MLMKDLKISKMNKAIIFGAGSGGHIAFNAYRDSYQIVAFTDNNSLLWGGVTNNCKIIPPSEIKDIYFDTIIIASLSADEIYKQLTEDLNIPEKNIQKDLFSFSTQVRVAALKNIAFELTRKGVAGNVAELGVYRGEFAEHINELFPDRLLYLFDTFEGFNEKDVQYQKELPKNSPDGNHDFIQTGHLSNTSTELVLSRMKYPENCRIYKGYFPETADDITNAESFCFVSIDVDLYLPQLAGLKYFYPKLTSGGIILLHDYYTDGAYTGIGAFDRFSEEYPNVKYVPIGDKISIAIVK